MLVLSRKATERLCIGEDIEITVIAIRGGRVRLGIACPTAVPIRRGELAPLEAPTHRQAVEVEALLQTVS